MRVKMIICKLSGGIGNQLFQYVNAIAVNKKLKQKLYFDISSFKNVNDHCGYQLDKYGIDVPILPDFICELSHFSNRIMNKVFKRNASYYWLQKNFNFEGYKYKGNVIHLDGTFQSELFFSNAFKEVEQVLNLPLDNFCEAVRLDIINCNSVSIHVRRGDYINNKVVSEIIGACSLDYYQSAINLMEEKFKNVKFFIFTDDVNWAKKNLKFESDYRYVDFNSGERSHYDIALMRCCKNNIISNSSFSWMGAWKANKDNTVICPYPWFNDISINTNDICPEEWVKLKK